MLALRMVSQGPSIEMAAEMDDAVDAVDDRFDLRVVGEIGGHEVFVGGEIVGLANVAPADDAGRRP